MSELQGVDDDLCVTYKTSGVCKYEPFSMEPSQIFIVQIAASNRGSIIM